MGKITVKHYLNTKVQPEVINDENYYPVYIQITINRKTTAYRSISLTELTEIQFNKYIQGYEYKANFTGLGVSVKEYFEKEPERIKKAFEYIIRHFKINKINKNNISNMWSWVNELFLMWTNRELIKSMWNYIECDATKEKIYKPFNTECSLNDCIKSLNKNFDIDIKNKIPIEDLELWDNTDLLLKHFGKHSIYIDFVCNYKYEIEKLKGIKNKERFIEIIKDVTENFYMFSD